MEEVRRIRLKQLREQFGGIAPLNRLLELSTTDSTLSQIVNASLGSKTRVPKTMGSPLARRLEEKCDKPIGWMDTDPLYDVMSAFVPPDIDTEKVLALTDEQLRSMHQGMRAMLAAAVVEAKPQAEVSARQDRFRQFPKAPVATPPPSKVAGKAPLQRK